MTEIAVIGAGAMGSAIAGRMISKGATVLTYLEGRSRETIDRATSVGMTPVGIERIANADIILSIVPPSEAVTTASRLADAMRQEQGRGTYIDLNAVAPETAQEVASCFDGGDAKSVDGCIIGGPPKGAAAGPHIYLSGGGDDISPSLAERGLDIRLLDGPIGAASALKMCYAGINKGLTGLATAMMLAAARCGADEALMAELSESVPDLRQKFSKSIPDMYPKAYRWVAEMSEIADFLGADDPASGIYTGMAGIYEMMARDRADDGQLATELTRMLGLGGVK